jgi:hypothetical protein
MFEILCEAKYGCMLSIHPMIFFSQLVSNIFSITLCIWLGLPHPVTLGLSHYIYGQPLDPMRIHLFRCAHGGERMASRDVMWDARMQDFRFYMNKLTFFRYPPFIFHVNKSTLWFYWMIFGCWHHHRWPQTRKMVLQLVLSYGIVTTIMVQLKMHYNKMHPCS